MPPSNHRTAGLLRSGLLRSGLIAIAATTALFGCRAAQTAGSAEAAEQPSPPAPAGAAEEESTAAPEPAPRGASWRQWRGPLGTGVAPDATPPLTWSETAGVKWKVALPGLGHSTPAVLDQRIVLTTAIPHGEVREAHSGPSHGDHDNTPGLQDHTYEVLLVDRATGRTVWQTKVADEQPHESRHLTASWASASPVVDSEVIVASFGSRGVFALDWSGKVLWSADVGDMAVKHGHGEGSSPALSGDTVTVNWDHEEASFVVALDKRTGRERWRVARDEPTSWSSPLVLTHAGRQQAIIAATNRVRAYDVTDGKVIWELGGLSGNVVATPVAGNGIVYAGSSYETRMLMAVKLDGAAGDITGSANILWSRVRDTPYVPSPVLYGEMLCFVRHLQGWLTCVEAATGRTLWGPTKLPGIRQVYASPVGAVGRLYVVGRGGRTVVLRKGATFEVLATNDLDDSFSASPVLVDSELLMRGDSHLYCLE